MPMRAQMEAAGYGIPGLTKKGARNFLRERGYGDELNLPEIEGIRAAGVSDEGLAKWIKKYNTPLGSQAAAQFGLEYLSSGANLRPEYVEQFKDAGYSNKEIRKAYKGTEGTIEDRAAEMIAPRKEDKKEFDLSAYDIASKGGKRFGLKDVEFLKSQGLSDEAITKYAKGLDSTLLGRRASSSLGLSSTGAPEESQDLTRKDERIDRLKAKNQELRQSLKEFKSAEKQKPESEKAAEFLDKTISKVTSTYKPEVSSVSSPTMLGGTQVASPSVTYGGLFAPEMKAPITQKITGAADIGDISISSEMSPTYENIGNVSAGIEGLKGENISQTGGVTTDADGIRAAIKNNLIEKAKAKKK